MFNGKYKNGLRYHGKGTEYYKENKIIKFVGQYKNGILSEGNYFNIKGEKEIKIISFKGIISRGYIYKQINPFEALIFHKKKKNKIQYIGIQINNL